MGFGELLKKVSGYLQESSSGVTTTAVITQAIDTSVDISYQQAHQELLQQIQQQQSVLTYSSASTVAWPWLSRLSGVSTNPFFHSGDLQTMNTPREEKK